MRFRTITLGCRVNQYETEFVRTSLLAAGWEEADRHDPASADLVIVNSCSVTAESDAKSRKMISGAVVESPRAEIIVMGCFATSNPEKAASFPHVTEVVTDKRRLPDFLTRRGWPVPIGIDSFGERHRAYVKIQDGCRVGCSYCLIPKVRPYLASRTEEEILQEVSHLAERGFREIVLTGIHLGHYGLDLIAADRKAHPGNLSEFLDGRSQTDRTHRHTLAALLCRLIDEKTPVRFRLGSLEAVEVSDELAAVVAENRESVCPHFHLSMQSGDDAVLARMKRRWPSGPYIDRCRSLRERISDVALTTDVIVGFPGETEAEFSQTCNVVREIGFAKTHIFRYSRRPGTEAADLPDQISESVKKERAARLSEIAQKLRADYARSFVGKEVTVLTENRIPLPSPEKRAISNRSAELATSLGTDSPATDAVIASPNHSVEAVHRAGPSHSTMLSLSGTSEFYLPVEVTFPVSDSVEKGVTAEKNGDSPCDLGRLIRVRVTASDGELLRGEATCGTCCPPRY